MIRVRHKVLPFFIPDKIRGFEILQLPDIERLTVMLNAFMYAAHYFQINLF